MALSSPGVEVSIIDQSQYLPAASNSVPLIILATASNKADATGTSVAAATTAGNAGKMYQLTSQRDLVTLYGSPFFYKTTNGTSIHGYELNEYGLLAAHSLLAVTNRCYVLRADVDLGSIVGQLSRPVGQPADGTYWLDTTTSQWGIYEFNKTTGKFSNITPIVITDGTYLTPAAIGGIIHDPYPKTTVGNIGDYAVIPLLPYNGLLSGGTYFYKTMNNEWVKVGSSDWKKSHPTVSGTVVVPNGSLTASETFTITLDDGLEITITIASGAQSATDVASSINARGIANLSAEVMSGKLYIYYSEYGVEKYLTLASTYGVLDDLGLVAGRHYTPEMNYGSSAEMPLWTASQAWPRPTGSVWIKTSMAGGGLDVVLSKFSVTTNSFNTVGISSYTGQFIGLADLDATGGKNIPAGTIMAITGTHRVNPTAGMMFYERLVTGPTVVTSYLTNPEITDNNSQLSVFVTVPGSPSLSAEYIITMSASPTATTFVTDWLAANIPNTLASLTTDGAIQLTHLSGGDIVLSDIFEGQSNGLLAELGFLPGYTAGVRTGVVKSYTNTQAVQATGQTGTSGSGATFSISNSRGFYVINSASGVTTGHGYQVLDTITINGSELGGVTGVNDLVVTVQAENKVEIVSGTAKASYSTMLSNWVELDYIANEGAPAALPADGTDWFFSTALQADIMVQQGGVWKGYANVGFDSAGHPSTLNTPGLTDPLGPIMSATAPTAQSTGSDLVFGDLWIDTNDLENYPVLYRWELANSVAQWVLIDTTDQTSSNGIVFADARWAKLGTTDPVSDPIPTISSLLTSNYLDLDAPSAALYPQGTLLWNTRRSGYNVKRFVKSYFTAANYPNQQLPTYTYTWVSASGLNEMGAAYMGRKAQRNMVVQALKAAVATNMSIREEDTFFNLISCPGYPELQPDMVALNNERNNTAYIIGDTPLRLKDQATELQNWANNTAGATSSGEDGLVTRDSYMGIFYPSGITTDLTGASVVVPSSHMMLRTFLRNDTVAYPWLAAAGTRRGTIDNATNIGYLSATTGEFQTVKNRVSIRDVLYTNQINPLAFFTGVGLLNYGNKTSYNSQSALDRTNVARLIAYIRYQVQIAARPFVFEPNDSLTRSQLTGVIQSLFIDLVAKRGLYDYLVVCDDSNNTPSRIDRNELWVDIAIEPVKAAEFIYIPVRVLNTGALAA
jgi:hypothetical protein